MNKYMIPTTICGLILIALFSSGCGPNISSKNQKILDNQKPYKELTADQQDEVFKAVVDVITVDLDTRKLAEGAFKMAINMGKLSGNPMPEAEAKEIFNKIATLPEKELRQIVKKGLESNERGIREVFLYMGLESPKDALVALEKILEIDSIMSEAKNDDTMKSDISKLLKSKLGHITDETKLTSATNAIVGFIVELNQHISMAFVPLEQD